MTEREWERLLYRHLKPLSREERRKIVEYYRELFGDKREAGKSEYEILLEFGSPSECAARILSEEYGEVPLKEKSADSARVWYWIGMGFLTLILILPLTAVAVSLVIAAGALAVSFGATSLAGIVVALAGFFLGVGSYRLVLLGGGLALSGLSMILTVLFLLATKYAAIGLGRALRAIYARR